MAEMKRAATAMGIQIEEPEYIELPDKMVQQGRNGEGYVDAIKKDLDPKRTMIVLIFLDDPRKKKKIK